MSLSGLSVEELREARIELDHQIAALRERKLAIAREIEARYPDDEPEAPRPAQAVAPAFVEPESTVPALGESPKRRRWGR